MGRGRKKQPRRNNNKRQSGKGHAVVGKKMSEGTRDNNEGTVNGGGYPAGLTNLGNTCFMNATLQCLSQIAELREGLKFFGTENSNLEIHVQPDPTNPVEEYKYQVIFRKGDKVFQLSRYPDDSPLEITDTSLNACNSDASGNSSASDENDCAENNSSSAENNSHPTSPCVLQTSLSELNSVSNKCMLNISDHSHVPKNDIQGLVDSCVYASQTSKVSQIRKQNLNSSSETSKFHEKDSPVVGLMNKQALLKLDQDPKIDSDGNLDEFYAMSKKLVKEKAEKGNECMELNPERGTSMEQPFQEHTSPDTFFNDVVKQEKKVEIEFSKEKTSLFLQKNLESEHLALSKYLNGVRNSSYEPKCIHQNSRNTYTKTNVEINDSVGSINNLLDVNHGGQVNEKGNKSPENKAVEANNNPNILSTWHSNPIMSSSSEAAKKMSERNNETENKNGNFAVSCREGKVKFEQMQDRNKFPDESKDSDIGHENICSKLESSCASSPERNEAESEMQPFDKVLPRMLVNCKRPNVVPVKSAESIPVTPSHGTPSLNNRPTWLQSAATTESESEDHSLDKMAKDVDSNEFFASSVKDGCSETQNHVKECEYGFEVMRLSNFDVSIKDYDNSKDIYPDDGVVLSDNEAARGSDPELDDENEDDGDIEFSSSSDPSNSNDLLGSKECNHQFSTLKSNEQSSEKIISDVKDEETKQTDLEIEKFVEEELKKPLHLPLVISPSSLTCKLYELFKEMASNTQKYRCINPRQVHNQVMKQFREGQQHDAHELLRFVIDTLKKDVTKKVREALIKEYVGAEYLQSKKPNPRFGGYDYDIKTVPPKIRKLLKEWDKILFHRTWLDQIFGGQLVTTTKCLECRNKRFSYEHFLDLSVPIPTKKIEPVNVNDCLSMFIQEEELTGENAVECQNCPKENGKTKRTSQTRQTALCRLPLILTVHLKRFVVSTFGSWGRGSIRKLNTQVDFPITLNLRNVYSEKNSFGLSHDKTYQVFGLVEHSGNLNFGHYVAHIKGKCSIEIVQQGNWDEPKDESEIQKEADISVQSPVWYCISDQSVSASRSGTMFGLTKFAVSDKQPYILFYRQKYSLRKES